MSTLCDMTMHALADALQARQVSSVQAVNACLAREEATRALGAYVHLDAAGALKQAAAADQRRARGAALGPLDGIPIALKDILLTAAQPTTCASRMLTQFIAPYDATVVARLRQAGLVFLGKLNMDEFAMGSSTESSCFGPTKNPWDPTRVPGGSSGGSAAAVASGAAFASLGTDTGGSIRQPAAFTGIVGLKPTYGRVSRYGVVAFASSLDQVGPMTRDVTDCAWLLQAIAGADPRDATSSHEAVIDYTSGLCQGVRGLRLGVPREYFAAGIDAEVRTHLDAACAAYRDLGATLVDVSLPHMDQAIATYYIIAPAEASSNLARFDGVRYGMRQDPKQGLLEMYLASRAAGFGPEVKRRIMLGTYVLSSGYYEAYYVQAQKVRTLVCNDFAAAFKTVDALLTPTTPTPAFLLGENQTDPVKRYLADIFTVGVNLAGLPALSLPCGFTQSNLPIGLQIIAAPFQEAKLLRIAFAYESAHDWHTRRPK